MVRMNINGRVALIACVSIGVAIYSLRWWGADAQESGAYIDLTKPEVTASMADSEEFRVAVEALGEIRDRATRTSDSPPAAKHGPAEPELMEWAPRTARNDFDLAELIMSGQYEAENLARHSLLNPADAGFTTAQWDELVKLIKDLRAASRPLRDEMMKVALSDRIAAIESGQVKALEEATTKADLQRQAEAVVSSQRGQGKDITLEDAKAQLSRGEVFAIRLTSNQTMHKGSKYQNSDFSKLPNYDELFEGLRFVAPEEASLIIGWFVGNGFTNFSSDLMAVVRRLQVVSPRAMDRTPSQRDH